MSRSSSSLPPSSALSMFMQTVFADKEIASIVDDGCNSSTESITVAYRHSRPETTLSSAKSSSIKTNTDRWESSLILSSRPENTTFDHSLPCPKRRESLQGHIELSLPRASSPPPLISGTHKNSVHFGEREQKRPALLVSGNVDTRPSFFEVFKISC
jgi:hypothetical protein